MLTPRPSIGIDTGSDSDRSIASFRARRAVAWWTAFAIAALGAGCSLTDLSDLSAGGPSDIPDADTSASDDATAEDSPHEPEPDGGKPPQEDGGEPEPEDAGTDASSVEDSGVSCGDAAILETAFASPNIVFSSPAANATLTWTTPDGAKVAKDDVAAQAAVGSKQATSQFLVGTNFSFGVPPSAQIVGIEIEIRRFASSLFGGTVKDKGVGIALNGKPGTVFRKNEDAWSTVATTVTYGGPTDTFGQTLLGSDLQDMFYLGASMAVDISAVVTQTQTANVDSIRMRLHYCEAPSATH